MNFERGKDPKKSIGIGIEIALKKMLAERIREAQAGKRTLMRGDLAKEIEEITGWKEVYDITNYDYPYILKFRFRQDKEIGTITISLKELG